MPTAEGTTGHRTRIRLSVVAALSAVLAMTGVAPAAAAPLEASDFVITKTVDATFDRTYLWDIAKSVDAASKNAGADGTATFDYVVEAIPGGHVDSAWAISGVITVANTNPLEHATVSVLETAGVGSVCSVAGGAAATIPAGTSADFPYSCNFAVQPSYDGSTTTTVGWGAGATTAATAVAFVVDDEINRTVDIWDDQTDPASPVSLGPATWNAEGTPTAFEYSLAHPGVDNSCVNFTNTAWIHDTGQDDDQVVTVCSTTLTVVNTATASFDRTYIWAVDKRVDATSKDTEADGTATFDFEVEAIPDGYIDSGWLLDGVISVQNTSAVDPLTVNVLASADVGGGAVCTVPGGANALITAGSTRVFAYSCTFAGAPSMFGFARAQVTSAGGPVNADAAINFTIDDAIDETVDVLDDMTDPANPVVLGTATWDAAGTPTTFPYTLRFSGVGGTCVGFTNTASLSAVDAPNDTQDVEVCDPSTAVPDVTTQVVGAPVLNSDGTWTIGYDITVDTPASNTLAAIYSLTDTLAFGAGITVLDSTVSPGAGTPAPLSSWTGVAPNTAVTDGQVTLPAGEAHTYRVTVRASVDAAVVWSLAARCSTSGGPAGFLNQVALIANGVTITADACAAPAASDIAAIPRTGAEYAGPVGFAALLAFGGLLLMAGARRLRALTGDLPVVE